MGIRNNNWIEELDCAARQWREDDTAGALKTLDEALAIDPSHALLRMQKYFMEKATEYKTGIPRIDMPPYNPDDPLISVIMATYNRTTWIRESIESVLAQTFTDWELIIVNDGGDLAVEEIISSYGDSRIRYIWAEHGGLSAALNVGLAHSRGKYIGFLDDDDLYYPEHLAGLSTVLETNPGACAAYSDYIQAKQKLVDGEYEIYKKRRGRAVDFDLARLILRNYIQPNAILIRREDFSSCGGFNEKLKYTLDRDMWIRLATRGDIIRMPEATCEYRFRPDGSSMSTDPSFQLIHFSNALITLHKGLLFESKTLQVWGGKSATQALRLLLDSDPDIIDTIDLRDFFEVGKPYVYFMEMAKKNARAGNKRRERAALKAAVRAAPYEVKLWFKLLKGNSE